MRQLAQLPQEIYVKVSQQKFKLSIQFFFGSFVESSPVQQSASDEEVEKV